MYIAVWVFVLYQPQQHFGGVEQDTHLYIRKYSGDLTFLRFDAINLARGGMFQHLQQSREAA